MTRDLILYGPDGEETTMPYKWEICSSCRGEGTSSAYLGAFTSDDWSQMDDEWKEDYIAGRFDRACEHCQGGKVKVHDRERMTKAQRKAWDAQQRAEHEVNQEEMWERRMLRGIEPGY